MHRLRSHTRLPLPRTRQRFRRAGTSVADWRCLLSRGLLVAHHPCSSRVAIVFVTPEWGDTAVKRVLYQAKKDGREVYVVKVRRRAWVGGVATPCEGVSVCMGVSVDGVCRLRGVMHRGTVTS